MPVGERPHARRKENASKNPSGAPMRTVPIIVSPSLLAAALAKT
jgi:hypothetical protein